MTASKVLIDSSAWIDYFLRGNPEAVHFIESGEFSRISSSISIHEVKKKLLLENRPAGKIREAMEFMKAGSIIADATEEICEKSAEDSLKKRLHLADSVIYRTAMENNARIVTLDSDFMSIKEAIILSRG